MFGLVAVAASVSMAFVGVSSALAEGSTAVCETHTAATCASPVSLVTFHQTGTSTLVLGSTTILCLSGNLEGHVEGGFTHLANPLGIEVLILDFSQCGTNAAHSNCEVTATKKGLLDLLKTALNLGTATYLGVNLLVKCIGIECNVGGSEIKGFELIGALHTASAGHGLVIANNLSMPTSGTFCPSGVAHWTAKFEPLVHLYLLE